MVIHLIGTVHYDLKGKERLEKALDIEKPDVITVEASQRALDYLKSHWQSDIKYVKSALREKGLGKASLDF